MILNSGPYRRSKLPVLNESYPADVSASYYFGDSTSVTFKVEISTDGKPAEYTYQWYKDGTAVSGATKATYTAAGLNADGTHSIYCIVTNKAGSVKSRTATLTLKGETKFLYYYGDQKTDASGGWVAADNGPDSQPDKYGSAEFQGDCLYVKTTGSYSGTYGGRCYTKKKINLTNYSKVRFTHSTYGRGTFAVASGTTDNDIVKSVKASLNWNGSSGTIDLDVSDLNGDYYIMVLAGPAEASNWMYTKCFSVRLE